MTPTGANLSTYIQGNEWVDYGNIGHIDDKVYMPDFVHPHLEGVNT